MDTIPQSVVDEVWEEVVTIPEEEGESRFHEAFEEQPAIAAYLLALDEQLLPPDEQGLLIMLGFSVLKVMSRSRFPLREITPEELEETEQANFAFLEQLDEGSEMDLLSASSKLISDYPQGPLLGAVLEALMEGYEENPEEAPENIGLLFLHLKTVIDCLDRVG